LKGGSSRRKRYLFLRGVTAVGILINPLENSGVYKMKKLSVLAVALSVATLGIPVFAYGQTQEMKQEEQKPKLTDIKGTVKADGDKITFVTDAEGKSWDVVNPETLKDHVGHHVEVSAHVYADKGQIHVMKVTMLKQ
jgi:membrane protein implicated in regulation of membrane protease activity